jgi:23S rRNA (guanosine2251-2'-O)-methyltransferase
MADRRRQRRERDARRASGGVEGGRSSGGAPGRGGRRGPGTGPGGRGPGTGPGGRGPGTGPGRRAGGGDAGRGDVGGRGSAGPKGRGVGETPRRPSRRARRAGGPAGPGARSARARSAAGPAAPGVRGPGRPGARGSEQRAVHDAAAPPSAAPREEREHDDTMILYGRNAVHEALRGRREVLHVWATRHAAEEPWLAEIAIDASAVAVNVVADGEWIERRCGSPDHQGVCAQVAPFKYAYVDELLSVQRPLIIALDEIQDPQNLGAIARTAECAGATGIVIPARRAADVTPAVCKASAGAVEHIPIARTRNLADFLREARAAGAWCYGAEGDGGRPYTSVDYAGAGVVLVMGSEGRGLRPRVAANCDGLVALPLRGRIESLNVNAAAAALIYEIVRQRDVAKAG